jgi:hypothetical protein
MAKSAKTVDLRVAAKIKTARLGDAELSRGYVYRCEPTSDEARHGSSGDGEEPGFDFGYHGTDIPPCAAEYLCDDVDGSGYLVISTEEDHNAITTVEGWTLVPAELDAGDLFDDGTNSTVIVKRHGGHEYTVASTL